MKNFVSKCAVIYAAPTLDVEEISVEKGFASSETGQESSMYVVTPEYLEGKRL